MSDSVISGVALDVSELMSVAFPESIADIEPEPNTGCSDSVIRAVSLISGVARPVVTSVGVVALDVSVVDRRELAVSDGASLTPISSVVVVRPFAVSERISVDVVVSVVDTVDMPDIDDISDADALIVALWTDTDDTRVIPDCACVFSDNGDITPDAVVVAVSETDVVDDDVMVGVCEYVDRTLLFQSTTRISY